MWIIPKFTTHSDREVLNLSYELGQYILKTPANFDRFVFVNNHELSWYPVKIFEQGFINSNPGFYYLNQPQISNFFDKGFTEIIKKDIQSQLSPKLVKIEGIDQLPIKERPKNIDSSRVTFSLSVCVPTFNRPKELKECILSLLDQSILPYEILICDDGSTLSEVKEVIEELKSKSEIIKSFKQKNSYVGAARNALIDRAKGEFIIFMDDDNLAHPWMIECFRIALSVEKKSKSPSPDILVSPIEVFKDVKGYPTISHTYFLGNSTIAGHLINVMGDAGICVRKSIASKLRYLENRDVGFEDWEFLLWAQAHQVKIETLPIIVYRYRVGTSSMRQTVNVQNSIQNAFQRVSKLGPKKLYAMDVEAAFLFQHYFSKSFEKGRKLE